MADEADDQDQAASGGKPMRFAGLSSAAMTALLDGSLAEAGREAGIERAALRLHEPVVAAAVELDMALLPFLGRLTGQLAQGASALICCVSRGRHLARNIWSHLCANGQSGRGR